MIGIDDKANIVIVLGDGDVGTGAGILTGENVPFLKFTQLDSAIRIGEDCTEQDKDEATISVAIKNLSSLEVLESKVRFVRAYLEKDAEKLHDIGYRGPMP